MNGHTSKSSVVERIDQYTKDDKPNTGMTHIVFAPLSPGKKALCGYVTKGLKALPGSADCVVCVSLSNDLKKHGQS